MPRGGVTSGKMGDIFERAKGLRPGACVGWFESLDLRDFVERALGDAPLIEPHPPIDADDRMCLVTLLSHTILF